MWPQIQNIFVLQKCPFKSFALEAKINYSNFLNYQKIKPHNRVSAQFFTVHIMCKQQRFDQDKNKIRG